MRTYNVEIRKNGVFMERFPIEAPDRRKAVHKAQLHFWYKYHGRLGTYESAIIVDDPYNEVHYSKEFNCKDKINLLLPEDIIIRLLQEANGELIRDTRVSKLHSARGSVRRVKRRRDFGKFIAPAIRQMKNGKLYYRINTRSQIMHHGERHQKRKYRDIPLEAQTLTSAIEEIKVRELLELNAQVQKRRISYRKTHFLEYLVIPGTIPSSLSPTPRKVIGRYITPANAM